MQLSHLPQHRQLSSSKAQFGLHERVTPPSQIFGIDNTKKVKISLEIGIRNSLVERNKNIKKLFLSVANFRKEISLSKKIHLEYVSKSHDHGNGHYIF